MEVPFLDLRMLKDTAIEDLRHAMDGLAVPTQAGLWGAIEPLRRLQESGLDVIVDFRATARLKSPVIIVSASLPRALVSRLSPRRRAVAELMLQGASNKDIARSLGISLGTVKDHVHDIFTILGVRSRAALISAALSSQVGR